MQLIRVDKEAVKQVYKRRNVQCEEAEQALKLFLTGKYGDVVEVEDSEGRWNNNNDMGRTLVHVIKKKNFPVREYMLNGKVYLENANKVGAGCGKDK